MSGYISFPLPVKRLAVRLLPFVIFYLNAAAQPDLPGKTDAWQEVLQHKKGTVTAVWDDIEPFIYTDKEGHLKGVEYEIMETLKPYLKSKYGVELTINWEKPGSFDSIYQKVKNSPRPGLFAWSYFSITPARQKEVQFTLPYMPDVNVLVTNNTEPMYASPQEFINGLKEKKAYTQAHTTMEEDVQAIRNSFYPSLPVAQMAVDYEVLKAIAADNRGFGYVPLSIYIVALQRGIKVKRQSILSSHRPGFAGVMPLHSDWKPVLDEYFASPFFRTKMSGIISKYLGSEIKDLVFEPVGTGNTKPASELDLVSLEKEIVTQRLMETAVEVQQQRSFRNIMLAGFFFTMIVALVLYSRFRTKQQLNQRLKENNEEISRQHNQIEQMNDLLKLKILQARMNPHFLFNSLNSIQYFIVTGDKKASLQYISRFSAFLRKVIHYGDELCITVSNEAELLNEYLWLEHYRFSDKFDYEISVAPDAQDAGILPLLTHSLVEEALYKGVLNLREGQKGKVIISFEKREDLLCVAVTDNGTTRAYSQELEKKKALLNGEENMLQRRIDLFNAQSRRKIKNGMEITDKEEDTYTTRAMLEIPQPLSHLIHV